MSIDRDALLRALVDVQYSRNDLAFTRGTFRVRGDTVEIIPAYEELAVRIEFFGDEVEKLYYLHPLTGAIVHEVERAADLPRDALRRRPGADGDGDPRHRGRAGRPAGRAGAPGQAAGGAAAADAHHLRRRDDAPGRILLGHRELLPAHRRPGRGLGAATLLDYFPDDFLLSSTSPT
jgi:excinuclease ABC subunit B